MGWTGEGLFEYPAGFEGGTVAVPAHRYAKALH